MRRSLPLAALLALVAAAPAQATFSGSSGKVAWVEDHQLKVDDPFDDAAPAVLAGAANRDGAMAPTSAPVWSPDGTKIAYTEATTNTDRFPDHSAVFVINADGTGRHQVSQPYPARVSDCDPPCNNGEVAWDSSPVWSSDDRVAWIRTVGGGKEAPHAGEIGYGVWVASASGGLPARIAHTSDSAYQGLVWPEGSSEPAVSVAGTSGWALRGASSNHTYASTSGGIMDFDIAPDGETAAYATPTAVVVVRGGTELDRFAIGSGPPTVRFTPDGNGLVRRGCANDPKGVQHCGLIVRRLPDSDGDVRDGEPLERPYLDGGPAGGSLVPDGVDGRAPYDLQSQDLPVLFAPGFLGSEIQCDGAPVWMSTPPFHFASIQLQKDGRTNANCPTAGPTGRVLGTGVYGPVEDWLESLDPPGGFEMFGWDWRKAPQETLHELDAHINALLGRDLARRQGAHRVTLMGHSYGGLLIRTYLGDPAHARKVARVLTVGSPFWGSPKALFPVTFGVEAPDFSGLDAAMDNDDLKAFAANLTGLYHLIPSDRYGAWLQKGDEVQTQDGVAAWVFAVGGNPTLLQQAWQHHRDNIEGFFDDDGRIDVRAVVGIGTETARAVKLTPAEDLSQADVTVFFGDGDGTVPGRSATQGPVGTADPFGDDIHIQNRCAIKHMDQMSDDVLEGAYGQFLVDGRRPRKLPPANCPPKGALLEIPNLAIPHVTDARPHAAGLEDAERDGLADVMHFPHRTLVVTDDARPVSISFDAQDTTFSISRLHGESADEPLVYGPVTGSVVVAPGGGEVRVDGVLVAPHGGGSPGGGGSSPGGSSPAGPSGGGSPGGGSPAPAGALRAALPRSARLKVSARGQVTVSVNGSAGASGTLTLSARGRRLGRAAVVVPQSGEARVRIRLSARARALLKRRGRLSATATLALRDAAGRTATARGSVTLVRPRGTQARSASARSRARATGR
jgi:hypothetical protein